MERTIISLTNGNMITNSVMSAKEILNYLEDGAIYRTFKDVLCRVYPCEKIDKILSAKLYDMCGGNPDTISRNIRNWLGNKNLPHREQLFQICFALELDEEQSNTVIAFSSETGIHYREPKEIIYAYCLKHKKTWAEAQQLCDEILPKCQEYQNVKFLNKKPKKFTNLLRTEFLSKVSNDEELKNYILDNAEDFTTLHLTAYADFLKMLSYLQNPDKEYDESYYNYAMKHQDELDETELRGIIEHQMGLKGKSVTEIVSEYMRMHVPENTGKKSGSKNEKRDFTHLQNAIKKNWPSESIISKMKNQDIDVSRKVMILLHLLTEEFEVATPISDSDEENFWILDSLEEDDDPIERMEIRINQLNLFLDSYGMNRLDLGNPFDCLVLYSLMASYEGEDDYMSERLENMLAILFEM